MNSTNYGVYHAFRFFCFCCVGGNARVWTRYVRFAGGPFPRRHVWRGGIRTTRHPRNYPGGLRYVARRYQTLFRFPRRNVRVVVLSRLPDRRSFGNTNPNGRGNPPNRPGTPRNPTPTRSPGIATTTRTNVCAPVVRVAGSNRLPVVVRRPIVPGGKSPGYAGVGALDGCGGNREYRQPFTRLAPFRRPVGYVVVAKIGNPRPTPRPYRYGFRSAIAGNEFGAPMTINKRRVGRPGVVIRIPTLIVTGAIRFLGKCLFSFEIEIQEK